MNQIDSNSSEYPASLKIIPDPPEVLYYRGEWNPELFEQTISVVGSRRMTRYGESMTHRLVTAIAREGITVVSGFMYGVDAAAHTATVDAPGRTIAVMPCGIERIHPAYQEELYGKILSSGGMILSEYTGDMPPALWSYPRRNRIVAALAPVLLVIEAAPRSGALITARLSRKYNKKIYALPGPLTSQVSLGTARLLKEGAAIVTGPEDILSEYGFSLQTGKRKQKKYTGDYSRIQKAIVDQLSREPMTADELIRHLRESSSRVGAELTLLTMKKHLILREGRYAMAEDPGKGENVCL